MKKVFLTSLLLLVKVICFAQGLDQKDQINLDERGIKECLIFIGII
jgi:hypothetical protein